MRNIFDHPKKTIALEELEVYLGLKEYHALCEVIDEMVQNGKIKPVNPKVFNGKNPPLAKKYRIVHPKKEYEDYKRELKSEIPTRFSIDYYRGNIEKYIEHRQYILPLARYYRLHKEALNEIMAINERSFDIWQEEKFLKDNHLAKNILKNIGLTMEDLNVYQTPEPFFYYSVTRNPGQNILIVENKDTWYTMRKLMREGYNCFFGREFGTIIYGEGKKIISSFNDIDDHSDDEKFLSDHSNVFYYFGDLDYEGMRIYQGLNSKCSYDRSIILFKEAYSKMVQIADLSSLKFMKKEQLRNTDVTDLNEAIKDLDHDLQKAIQAILKEGKYIPQEIINYQTLKEGE